MKIKLLSFFLLFSVAVLYSGEPKAFPLYLMDSSPEGREKYYVHIVHTDTINNMIFSPYYNRASYSDRHDALIEFTSGLTVYAKLYRTTDGKKMLRGEVYAYHLLRWLGFNYVPPTSLLTLNYSEVRWQPWASQLSDHGWQDESVFVVSEYIEPMYGVYKPRVLSSKQLFFTSQLHTVASGYVAESG